mmetsp:Transcript_28066/g.26928  ORF Transcript_28066/g.26928 Transcript_28066/m.26928 type:complete len:103 (-) Transcript_28066:90-398(-)
MDYRGQKLSENIYYILTILFGAIAWIVGYSQGDFQLTFYGWLAGLIISLVLCIPDWPMFNRNPVTWLEEISHNGVSSAPKEVAATKKTKKSKKSIDKDTKVN